MVRVGAEASQNSRATTAASRSGWARLCLAALFAIAVTPRTAQAHLVTSGGGPFFDGLIHFYVSPDDFLTVLAVALFSGLSGKRAARGLVLTLPAAWLLGTVAGMQVSNVSQLDIQFAGVSMLCTGLLLGINLKLPTGWLILVGLLIGAWHGFTNGLNIAATGTSGLAAIGNTVAASLVALLLSAAAVSLTKSWQLIAVRVVGSWVAAIGLLVLAWQFRPGG
jgi:hydrogenase/urease accessory protein HupE